MIKKKIVKGNIEQIEDHKGRVRFQKPEYAMDHSREDPYGCIAEVFIWIHLDDFHDLLDEWLRIALINDQSAYDEGASREDVMDFCDELQILTEALQVINQSREPDDRRKWRENLPDDLGEKIESYNQPVLLTGEQKADPLSVIRELCRMFTLSYARRELWDLMDSVVFYERGIREWAPDPHVTYRCLLALVESAYVIYQLPDHSGDI